MIAATSEVNPIPPIYINVALIILTTALGVLVTLFFNSRKNATEKVKNALEEKKEMEKRVVDLEGKMALVNAAIVPISTAFQAILIKELTHFHTPEMDALLVKVGPPNVLTTEEHSRLSDMLRDRTKDLGEDISPSERDAAHILPAVMKRAAIEQDTLNMATDMNLKLITIAEVIGVHQQKDETTK